MPHSSKEIRQYLSPGKRVFFAGVGGFGMSALARYLHQQGIVVSGVEARKPDLVKQLRAEGILAFETHQASNVDGSDCLFTTYSVPQEIPEIQRAKALEIPIVERPDLLRFLIESHWGIAVVGSHGKTTTSGLLAFLLRRARCNVGFILGGENQNLGTNGYKGESQYLVTEVDESDGTFVRITPQVAIVTSLAPEHMNHYQDPDRLYAAFKQFCQGAQAFVVVNLDWAPLMEIALWLRSRGQRVITCSIKQEADWTARGIRATSSGGMSFDLYHGNERISTGTLALTGGHNVANAVAAIAAAAELGINPEESTTILKDFQGMKRRFELLGEYNGSFLYDDFACHPNEMKATLEGARLRYPVHRIWAVLQPHRYTRIQSLFDQYGDAFAAADHILVMDIFAHGETHPGDPRCSSEALTALLRRKGKDAIHTPSAEYARRLLQDRLQPGDVVVAMGPGNVDTVITGLVAAADTEGR